MSREVCHRFGAKLTASIPDRRSVRGRRARCRRGQRRRRPAQPSPGPHSVARGHRSYGQSVVASPRTIGSRSCNAPSV